MADDMVEIHSHYDSTAPSSRLGHLSTVAVTLQFCSVVKEKKTWIIVRVLGIKVYSANKWFEEYLFSQITGYFKKRYLD